VLVLIALACFGAPLFRPEEARTTITWDMIQGRRISPKATFRHGFHQADVFAHVYGAARSVTVGIV